MPAGCGSCAPGQGSTFGVHLPQTEHPGKLPERELALLGSSLSGSETILLVEDDASVRGAARRFLEEHGYCVLEASHGREALRLCRQHEGPLDLVITTS